MDFVSELVRLVKTQTVATFNQVTQAQGNNTNNLKYCMWRLAGNYKAEERYIDEEMDLFYRKLRKIAL